MVIRRVGPLSVAKIAGVLYALIGVFIGAIFSLVAMGGAFASSDSPYPGFLPAIFGVAGIFILPILYGCFGFVGSLITAWLYNMLAGAVGGVELDIQ
jgi:hypothetical protein